jgi:membrane protein implicated in regulation of membrane protease activity
MLDALFSSGTLNLVYTIVFGISFIFALIGLIGAEIGDVLDFDVDADSEGIFDFVSISPFALAMFGAIFGMVGLITRLWLDMEAIPSIIWSAGSGIVIGAAAQAFFIYILSPSKSSHYSLTEDATGREAEVIITIPESGLGQVAFNNVSGRVTMGARSSTGQKIRNGDLVTIERIVGRVAIVRPYSEEL